MRTTPRSSTRGCVAIVTLALLTAFEFTGLDPRGVPATWPPNRQPGQFNQPADGSLSDFHYVFEAHHAVRNYLRDSQCNFWEPFFFRSVLGTVPAAAR
jgi:hypothetical protein